MLDLRERSRIDQFSGHGSAETVVKIDHPESRGAGNHDLYTEHRTCYRLLDDLNDAIIEGKPRSDAQDMVRRLFIAVAMHFRHEEHLFTRYGFLDGQRHSELHSNILARYLRLTDELDKAVLPAVWIKCVSVIEQILTGHMTEEAAMYGYGFSVLSYDREADLSLLSGNRHG